MIVTTGYLPKEKRVIFRGERMQFEIDSHVYEIIEREKGCFELRAVDGPMRMSAALTLAPRAANSVKVGMEHD